MAKVATKAAPRKSKSQRQVEEGHIGRETVDWSVVKPAAYKKNLDDTIRHYGYFYEKKAYCQWVESWLAQYMPEGLEYYSYAESWMSSSTLAGLCRMEMNGCVLSAKNKATQLMWAEEIVERGKFNKASIPVEVSAKAEVKRKTPVELLAEKTADFLGEIEGFIDEFLAGTLDKDWSIYNEMKKAGSAAQTARDATTVYAAMQEELRELVFDKTEDLLEGYSNIGVRKQKSLYTFITNIVEDCEKYLISKKATRKPRAKKATPASTQVAKVLYLKESKEYKITSVDPAKLVGAQAVYLFNTKTRVLKYLVSNRREGFIVKGSTIQGFDEELSIKKMLRKPEEMLELVGKATKAKALKGFKALTTKETASDGRINRDTIILKVLT
tara:strand:- start:195 stop:1346 length:1152 start_codon:yes stop_codon:yes gene_type:complete